MLSGRSWFGDAEESDGVNSTLLEMWGSLGLAVLVGEALQPTERRPAMRPANPREANFKRRRAVLRAEEDMSGAPRCFN